MSGLDDIIDDGPNTAAARRGAAMARQHPDFDSPGPDGPVPDFYDEPEPEEEHPSARPLELLRFDRLPIELPPEAGVLYRPDGRGLFYMAAVTSIAGDPGVGKTFAALLAAVAALAAGGSVLLIDYEDTPGRLRGRLIALGVPDEMLARTYGIRDPDRLWPTHVEQLRNFIIENAITVVVIDAVTEALEAHDLDENSGGDYSRWHRTVARPLAAAGPAVILIDHRPKPPNTPRGATARGLWAVATRQKLAAIDLSYVLEAREPFSKADPGRTGKLDLIIAKDKHGAIGARGDIVARFELTPTTAGAVTHDVVVPPHRNIELDEDGNRVSPLDRIMGRREEILPLIHDLWTRERGADPSIEGLSTNRVIQWLRTLPIEKRLTPKLGGRPNDYRDALQAWADSGYLKVTKGGPGGARAVLWRPKDAVVVDLFHPEPTPEPDDEGPFIDPVTGAELDF